MKFADFVIPATIDEARAALKSLGDAGMPVAGATAMQYLSDRDGVTAVDISRLDFGGIALAAGTYTVGANTTLSDLVHYEGDGWVLGQIAYLIPTHQVRNISTIAGNICRLFPWSEIPLGLLVMGGTVMVLGDKETDVSADDFFKGQPRELLKGGKLVTRVTVPALKAGQGFGYRKENITNSAFGLATAAAFLDVQDGTIAEARVAAGSALPVPTRIPEVEAALKGQPAEASVLADAAEAGSAGYTWTGREGMSNEFAAHLAKVIITDALEKALNQAKGA